MRSNPRGFAHAVCAAGLAVASATAAPVAARAEPADYALDPAHSWVHFELLHFGTSTIRGRLGPARGTVTLDRAAGTGRIAVELSTGSVDTGLAVFDARIRKDDLLAAEAHPTAWFVATRLRFDAEQLVELRGELTLHGTSQPFSLKDLRFSCRMHPTARRELCGGDFEGTIKRSDFGISFGLPFVADTVRLVVQVEGLRTVATP